jgi:hypothetical protein
MQDEALDWLAAPGALAAVIHHSLWLGDRALKKGSLSPADAEAVRQCRVDLQAQRKRLCAALSRISAADAAEIEHCVARLLHGAGWIWHLHPLPTPNVRKTVKGDTPRRARAARASSPRAQAINRACEAEFSARLKTSDGKVKVWTEARLAAAKINASLKKQGFKPMSQHTAYQRFRKFLDQHR